MNGVADNATPITTYKDAHKIQITISSPNYRTWLMWLVVTSISLYYLGNNAAVHAHINLIDIKYFPPLLIDN